ncbi:hypothetical protein M3Y98_01066700 [Aphelenchoides besseyi]|nr:hypothetical protein M3Y98_01066700 [Aphelenchoides besseyi]KAI6209656.1 hypothetical protein M3Y96_00243800 [Aphelenchoides besseyi]
MTVLVSVLLGLIGLFFFLSGLTMGLFELCEIAFTITVIVFGLLVMSISAAIWLKLLPRSLMYALRFSKSTASRGLRQRPFGIVGVLDINSVQKGMHGHGMIVNPHVNHDTTESLLKSIHGIPFLIQAIQYSLETNIMSEMGQSIIGTSVIHTAPGCTSVLDCDSEDEHILIKSATPRLSGVEEQWENTEETNRWTNQQLNISLNRANSTLNVFPYSESRPLDDLSITTEGGAVSSDHLNMAGSAQSSLSRVTVSYNSANQREVRCIGMSSAFLSRFNNSFKT